MAIACSRILSLAPIASNVLIALLVRARLTDLPAGPDATVGSGLFS